MPSDVVKDALVKAYSESSKSGAHSGVIEVYSPNNFRYSIIWHSHTENNFCGLIFYFDNSILAFIYVVNEKYSLSRIFE